MLLDLTHPVVNALITLLVRGVIDNDDAVSSLVIGRGDGFEALLACRVPDLQLDCLAVNLQCADFLRLFESHEVYANRWHEVVREGVVLS